MAFVWFVYAAWILLIAYLTLRAAGVKRDIEPHLLQSVALLFAMIAALLLPHVPVFAFLNFAPVNAILSSIGVVITLAGWLS